VGENSIEASLKNPERWQSKKLKLNQATTGTGLNTTRNSLEISCLVFALSMLKNLPFNIQIRLFSRFKKPAKQPKQKTTTASNPKNREKFFTHKKISRFYFRQKTSFPPGNPDPQSAKYSRMLRFNNAHVIDMENAIQLC